MGPGRAAAPRLGLSKASRSAPASSIVAPSGQIGPVVHFKPPLRRSPRKAGSGTANTASIHDAQDPSNCDARAALFQKSTHTNAPLASTPRRVTTASVGEQVRRPDSIGTNETSITRDSDIGDTSFDTSMTSYDESAFCELADLVEASQSVSNNGKANSRVSSSKVDEAAPLQNECPSSEDDTRAKGVDALPTSDDSLDISLDGHLDAAVLASMDAKGW